MDLNVSGDKGISIYYDLGGLPMDAAMGYEIIPLRLVSGMKDLMLQGYGIYGHVERFALKQIFEQNYNGLTSNLTP